MARRPFKIVADLDLSGNSLLDVTFISRLDHETLDRALTVQAGSGSSVAGGDLNLFSGSGSSSGAINLFLGKDKVNKYGIEILGSSATTIKTNNQDVTVNPGSGSVKILSENDAISNVTGALQLAGGLYVAKTLRISGNVVAAVPTISVVNETATTINFAGAATKLNIANTATQAQTISIGTSVVGATEQSIVLGGATSAGTVKVSSTKEASGSSAAFVISGGLLAHKSIVGLTSLQLPNSSETNPLTLGTTHIYEATECLNITSCLVLHGEELTAPETFDFAKTSTVLNIASPTGTTTIRNNLVVNGTTELKGEVPYVYMAPQAVAPGASEGLLYYSAADKSLNYITDIAEVTVNLGFESIFRVANATGATIPNGAPIYLTGNINASGVPECALAQANNYITARAVGVTTNDILSGEEGYAALHGVVRGVNTTSFAPGTLLYLDASTAGMLTSTPPGAGNYVIKIARVLTSGTAGTLLISLGVAWSDTSTFNIMRVNELAISTELKLPTSDEPSQTAVGSVVWDSTLSKLTIGTGTSRVTLVDTDSEQALTNKTINGLTISEGSGTLTIANGFELDVQASLSTGVGSISLIGAEGGLSELVLPNTTVTISELTSGHLLYASAANTVAGMATLDAARGGTGIYSYNVGDMLVASASNALTTLSIGNANQLLGVKADGSTLEYKTVSGGGDVIISNEAGVLTIATTQSVAPTANVTFASLTLSGYLAVNGGLFSSTSESFSFLNEGVTTLNMLAEEGATLNIGADDSLVRKVNLLADTQIGTSTNNRTLDVFGQVNFGGPTGYTIQWNPVDNSLDFVKL